MIRGMGPSAPLRCALLLLLAGLCQVRGPAQDRPPAQAQSPAAAASETRTRRFIWSAELPPAWRELERQEAAAFEGKLFADTAVRAIERGELALFGAIDAWRETGVRGGALAVVVGDGERQADEAFIRELGEFYAGLTPDRCEVLDARLGTLGDPPHPVVQMTRRVVPAADGPVFRSFDVFASTSGKQLILSFRAWENEYAELEPSFRAIASSLSFARPPRKPGALGDSLLQAAVFGGFLTVGLFLLRAIVRRRTSEHLLPSDRDRGAGPGNAP